MKYALYLTVVAASISNISQAANKELCVLAESSVIDGNKSVLNTTYGEIRNGHVNFFGKGCYSEGNLNNCAPVLGAGILHDDEIEVNFQSVEYERYDSQDLFAENTIHATLNLDTLKGYYAASASLYSSGQQTPVEIFDTGTITAIPCPPVTKEEKNLDNKLKRAIKKLDNLK